MCRSSTPLPCCFLRYCRCRGQVDRQEFGQARMSETIPIEDYVNAIDRTLENGTHRAGTMRTISLVGCMQVCGRTPPPGAAFAA